MQRLLALPLILLLAAGCDFVGADGEDDTAAPTERLHPVKMDGRWGYINTEGRITVPPAFDAAGPFFDGRGAVQQGVNWGYVDRSGTLVVAAQFQVAGPFREERAPVRGAGLGDPYGFVDPTGRSVIEPQYELALPFSEGRAAVRLDGRWGYIDRSGAYVVEPRYSDARSFSEGLAAVEGADGWAFIDRDGVLVIDPAFSVEAVGDFSDGRAPFLTSDGWGYFDAEGRPAIPPRYDHAAPFAEGAAVVEQDHDVFFIDPDGQRLFGGALFHEAHSFSEGLAAVRPERDWVYIRRRDGAVAIEREFTAIEPFDGGLARVFLGHGEHQRLGYIDRDGAYVWYPTR